jgi:hypothetical protein
LTCVGKEHEYQKLQRNVNKMWRELHQWTDEQHRAIRQNQPLPSWQAYLREAAAKGNEAALAALMRNARRYRQAVNAISAGDRSEAARALIMAELKPQTLANGHIVYRLRDGGKVVDDGAGIKIEKDSHVAIALTLGIMAGRSPSREVVISDPQHQQAMIEAAARDKLNLRFADPSHEKERQRLIEVCERDDAAIAAAGFIARRNEARATRAEIPPHRLWNEGDAGSLPFEAVLALGEGFSALMVRKDAELLVLPLTAAEAGVSAARPAGGTVEISRDGRIAQQGQRR